MKYSIENKEDSEAVEELGKLKEHKNESDKNFFLVGRTFIMLQKNFLNQLEKELKTQLKIYMRLVNLLQTQLKK